MAETDTYGWRMTPAGLALIASAIASNTPIGIATLVLGDGGGSVPPVSATGIVREVWRGPVSTVRRAPDNPLLVEVQAVVPVTAGPFVIREAAILSTDGTPLALCRRTDLYKGGPQETHTIDMLARIAVSDAAVIDMTVDSGTYATLMALSAAISDHANSRNHPDATEAARGFVRLATVPETQAGTMATVAVHPAGLSAALAGLASTVYVDAAVASVPVPDLAPYLRRSVSDVLTAGYWTTPVPLSAVTGVITPDLAAGNVFTHTLTAATTLAFPATVPGAGMALLYLRQDATGGRALTLAAGYRLCSGSWSTDPEAINILWLTSEAAGATVLDVVIAQRGDAV